jgi:hypothetical protein
LDRWHGLVEILRLSLVRSDIDYMVIGIMEGEDINDSNCINFQNINKIRDRSRLIKGENLASLKGVRVGLVEEFDIEELDMRNRAM